ncbi:MAG: hypothetical protein E6G50_06980 [Actinobacteria bacterium]|nr:MAG: hypothetical protein E6G50_06980 [Actinomycetota bacterium]
MARNAVWRGRTPGGLPLTVEREDHPNRWIVTVLGAVRCRDSVLSSALASAVGLEETSIWVRHVTSLVVGLAPGANRSCGERPQGESATQ